MRILFIGTDASVSGAPRVLEHFESYFAAQPGIRIGTLLLRGGPRLARFERLGPTVILSRRRYAIPYRLKRLRDLVLRTAARQAIGRLRAIDLIFVNSLCTKGIEGHVINGARCTVVTHTHELRHVFDRALTSREDSFALVMLEAAAAGLPVVAFESSGGTAESLVGGAGITVPYGDVEQMAEVVARLIDDAEMRDAFCRKGRERVARFDRSVVAANIGQRLQTIPAMQALWPRGAP